MHVEQDGEGTLYQVGLESGSAFLSLAASREHEAFVDNFVEDRCLSTSLSLIEESTHSLCVR